MSENIATYIVINKDGNDWFLADGCEIRAIPFTEVERLADGGLTLSATTNISRSRMKVTEAGNMLIVPILDEIERSEDA